MLKVLFVDACPRNREVSRSYQLGKAFLDEYLRLNPSAAVVEYRLDDQMFQPLTGQAEMDRSSKLASGNLDAPMFKPAWDFAQADRIVICAPYWDYAFPACLKTFIEHVCVYGITFRYVNGMPEGLCRAEHLVYLTTAGSPIGPDNWGGDYLKAVTSKLLGVKAFHQISADGLDLDGADVNALVNAAISRSKKLAAEI